jgi:hypothetical protein
VVWTRIESILWSLFTVKVIDYRFRFLQSIWSPSLHIPNWEIQTVQVQSHWEENARREASACLRRDEEEGRAAAQAAGAQTAGVSVRGCVCLRALTPQLRAGPRESVLIDRC